MVKVWAWHMAIVCGNTYDDIIEGFPWRHPCNVFLHGEDERNCLYSWLSDYVVGEEEIII